MRIEAVPSWFFVGEIDHAAAVGGDGGVAAVEDGGGGDYWKRAR